MFSDEFWQKIEQACTETIEKINHLYEELVRLFQPVIDVVRELASTLQTWLKANGVKLVLRPAGDYRLMWARRRYLNGFYPRSRRMLF